MGHPGKFEGCADYRLGKALYNVTLDGGCDEELGECDGFGWYGLIKSKNKHIVYIVREDSQGFFDYVEYSPKEAEKVWSELEAEYKEFATEEEGETDN